MAYKVGDKVVADPKSDSDMLFSWATPKLVHKFRNEGCEITEIIPDEGVCLKEDPNKFIWGFELIKLLETKPIKKYDRYYIKVEYLIAVPLELYCVSVDGGSTTWDSYVDHPSFTELREHLEKVKKIKTQASWGRWKFPTG